MSDRAAKRNCKLCGAKPEHQTKITSLQNVRPQYPKERGILRDEGPWRAVPSTRRPPYMFAVVGKNEIAVAYTRRQETAESYAEQMNRQGYIEVYP